MRTVIIKMSKAGQFLGEMNRMRAWLETTGCSPSSVKYDVQPASVIVHLEFTKDQEAEDFKQVFDGVESGFVALAARQLPETIEQVCRWRLTAEEIRTEAEVFGSKEAQETMAQVAQTYDGWPTTSNGG